jgi:hypothetical protein
MGRAKRNNAEVDPKKLAPSVTHYSPDKLRLHRKEPEVKFKEGPRFF